MANKAMYSSTRELGLVRAKALLPHFSICLRSGVCSEGDGGTRGQQGLDIWCNLLVEVSFYSQLPHQPRPTHIPGGLVSLKI